MKNIFCRLQNAVVVARARQVFLWLLGLGCMSCAGASPLFICPGNLFSNNLDPLQARAMGCQSVQPGRLSQAHGTPTASDEPAASGTAAPAAAPLAMSARKPAAPELGHDAVKQRQRDSHAREIIQAELARRPG